MCVINANMSCFVWCNLTLAALLISKNCSILCCVPGLKHWCHVFTLSHPALPPHVSSHASGRSSQLQAGASKQQHTDFCIWAHCLLWRTQRLASIAWGLCILLQCLWAPCTRVPLLCLNNINISMLPSNGGSFQPFHLKIRKEISWPSKEESERKNL